jgi:aminomethyltransferase
VETLETGSGAYNLVLNAQGRIQGDAVVWRVGDAGAQDALTLELTAAQSPALMAHFDHFIVMDDVELVPLEGQSAIGLTGPGAGAVLVALGLPALAENTLGPAAKVGEIAVHVARGYGSLVPHYELWAEAGEIPALWERVVAAGAVPVGAEALETLRIVEGIALYGTDIESRDLPQETSQTRALHYTKGCYLGQEIVERIRSRGQVHRHLRQLELTLVEGAELPGPGTEVRKAEAGEDSKALATITSITRTPDGRVFALGVVRAEAELGNPTLVFPGGTARVLTAPPNFS